MGWTNSHLYMFEAGGATWGLGVMWKRRATYQDCERFQVLLDDSKTWKRFSG